MCVPTVCSQRSAPCCSALSVHCVSLYALPLALPVPSWPSTGACCCLWLALIECFLAPVYWMTAAVVAPAPEPESHFGDGGAAEAAKTRELEQQPNPAATSAPSDTGGADGDGRIDTL